MATIISALQRVSGPPAQTLWTLQPTPATVCYTVSTRKAATTPAGRLRGYGAIALRLVVGLGVGVVLWIRGRAALGIRLACGEALCALVEVIETLPWQYLVPAALLVLYLALKRGYKEESLTVMRGLGLQTSTTSSIYLRTPTTTFIPTTSIQDIFIHEAFKGFEVRFYLAVVVKQGKDVVVVFPTMLPRREILEDVWRGSRACLWDQLAVDRNRVTK